MLKFTKDNIGRISLGISLGSLILAIVSLVLTTKTDIKTNKIADTANLLQIIADIQQRTDAVFTAKQNIDEYVSAITNGSSPIDSDKGDLLADKHEDTITSLLNAYEFACSQYLNNKIDKKAFKDFYFALIEHIKTVYGPYLNPRNGVPRYQAINDVYTEWYGR